MAAHPGDGHDALGQPYGSPVEAWLAAPFVAALGPTTEALRLFLLPAGPGAHPRPLYAIASRLDVRAALPAALLLWRVPPPYFLLLSVLPPPLYPAALALLGASIALTLYAGERLAAARRCRGGGWCCSARWRARGVDASHVAGRAGGVRRLPLRPRPGQAPPPRGRAARLPDGQRAVVDSRAVRRLGHAHRQREPTAARGGRSPPRAAAAPARAAGRRPRLAHAAGARRPRRDRLEPARGGGARHLHLWRVPGLRRALAARSAGGAAPGRGRADGARVSVPAALGPRDAALPDAALPSPGGARGLGRDRARIGAPLVPGRARARGAAPRGCVAPALGVAHGGPHGGAVPSARPGTAADGARAERHPPRVRVLRSGLPPHVRERRAHRRVAAVERALPAPSAAVPRTTCASRSAPPGS
jgi:hypothetical protein